MKCHQCNQQHPLYHGYCPHLGKHIDEETRKKYTYTHVTFCENCGHKNKQDYTYCPGCGHMQLKVEKVESAPEKIIPTQIKQSPVQAAVPIIGASKPNVEPAIKDEVESVETSPFMFIPAFIPILLLLLMAFMFSDTLKKNVDVVEDLLRFDVGTLLEEETLEEYDVNADIPKFPLIETQILLMNNNSLDFTFSNGYENYNLEMKIFYVLLVLPMLFIAIAGVFYGLLAKRNKWGVRTGVYSITAVYTISMVALAFLGQYELSFSYDGNDEVFITLSPSVLETVLNAFIVSLIMSFVTVYITYYGKRTFAKIQSEMAIVKYAFFAIMATMIGMFTNLMISFVTIKDKVDDLSAVFWFFELPDTIVRILTVTLGMLGWGTSYFGEVSFNDGSFGANFVDSGIKALMPSKIVLVGITVLILVGVGYFLAKYSYVSFVDILVIAALFAGIQLLVTYAFGISMSAYMDGEVDADFYLGFTYSSIAIGSFLTAFGSIFVGTLFSKNVVGNEKE